MTTQTKAPLMYNGWVIKKVNTPFQGIKLSAYNFRTDVFLNPLYSNWIDLKTVIDAIKD